MKILITGCSSGFGRMLVSACLEKGWHVVATMRNAEKRTLLFEKEKAKYGANLEILNLDVTNSKDIQSIASKFKELDCLINNAGFGVFSALEDVSEKLIREQIEINVTGLILLTRAMLPALRKSSGHIINFSSVLGFSVLPLTSLYCASKYAVEGFSESLYYELRPHGVSVSIVEPGAFATDFKTNVVFGEESFSKDSPYHWQSENYKKHTENALKYSGNPEVVVNAVMKAVEQNNPPLRIRCGKDAVVVHLAKRLAPSAVFRMASQLFFGMTINKK